MQVACYFLRERTIYMAAKEICSLENKNVLVTVGAGFIGSHLIDHIIENENKNAGKLVVADNFFLGKPLIY